MRDDIGETLGSALPLVEGLKKMTSDELKEEATRLRELIIQTVSETGGHFSSPLGAVDIIVAMHYVFDVRSDPFIFDVSHQAYAHKLLTGREESFHTLRQFEGMCGFTNPRESQYDYCIAGHSSTSISLGVGAAKAIALQEKARIPVCLVGDGSMSAGLIYEALNELGERKYPLIIILNDNEMSIAKPIGAISKYLSRMLSGGCYQRFKKSVKTLLDKMPKSVAYVVRKIDDSLKLITPGMLFEELGVEYIGPIDGHNIDEIVSTLQIARNMQKPVIIHAGTIKGKGYKIAEGQLENWHGVGSFDVGTGKSLKKSAPKNATQVFSEHLQKMANEHSNIAGITAAMPSGTGLSSLIELLPKRFFDVGIAEQHGVTSAAAMAKEGLKPFVAIYSTFLQRAYDQIIHDVCISALPVVFIIDRAGIVGEDGETHQGVFDISYLRAIPNIHLLAPRDNASLESMLEFAYRHNFPCAIRIPRGDFALNSNFFACDEIRLGKSQILIETQQRTDEKAESILLIGYGNGVGRANEVSQILLQDEALSEEIGLLDLVFVKPLDRQMLLRVASKYKKWFVFSESAKMGGVASALLEFCMENDLTDIQIKSFEYGDDFITHGNKAVVEQSLGLKSSQIAEAVIKNLKK